METAQLSEGEALVARLSELPPDELLRAWESFSSVVAERALDEPTSLTSAPVGGTSVDGRLDALIATRRELEHAAVVAQRVARRADAVTHLVAGAHHAAVAAYDQLSVEAIEVVREYPGEAGEYAAAALAACLGLATPAARSMAGVAASLRQRHPRLMLTSVAGEGATRVAGMLADELSHLDQDDAHLVESALIDAGVHRRSYQAARERCRVVLRQMGLSRRVDPVAAEQERGVWFEPHLDFDSLCRMTAVLDAHDATSLKAVIEERARQLWENSARGRTPRAGAARADALVDLMLENSQVTATINLTVPVSRAATPADALPHDALPNDLPPPHRPALGAVASCTGAGAMHSVSSPSPASTQASVMSEPPRGARLHSSASWMPSASSDTSGATWHSASRGVATASVVSGSVPVADRSSSDVTQTPSGACSVVPLTSYGACSVPGVGVIPAHVITELAAHAGTGFTATLTTPGQRVTTLATTTHAYRPTVGIAKLVRERDGVCRFPYCTASAIHADLDHVMPFDRGGPTTASNLQALCRHHHRAKTHGGFTVTMTPDGDCTWTSPTGSRWLTEPGGTTYQAPTPVRAA